MSSLELHTASQFGEAEKFYQQSVKLAPYNLEFRNKYGVCLFNQDKLEFAIDEFKFIINEDNNFVSAQGGKIFLQHFLRFF